MDPKRHNILIVDDEEHNLDTLRRTFRKKYNVFAARNGEEGLSILRDKEIAVVITDQKMPGMTGREFLRRILADHPQAVRIVLTGYPDGEGHDETWPSRGGARFVASSSPAPKSQDNGHVYRYLTKPWSPQELQIAVTEALEAYEKYAGEKGIYDFRSEIAEIENRKSKIKNH